MRPHIATDSPRLPAALPMALVALAALYLTSRHWMAAVCAAALLAAQLSERRFDGQAPLVRIGRYALFAAIAFGAYERFTKDIGGDSLEMMLAHTVGALCAAELALQAWLARPVGGVRSPAALLLATMIFLAASNTFETRFIPFLAPLFFLCAGVALCAYAPRHTQRGGVMLRGFALLLVVALGAGTHFGVWRFRNEISQWGMKFIEGKDTETSGLSTSPSLGSSFEFRAPLTRMLRAEGLPANSYLRAMAFDEYQDGRWLPLIAGRSFSAALPSVLHSNAAGRRARIERLKDDNGLIFSPLEAAGLAVADSVQWDAMLGPLRTNSSEEITPRADYEIILGAQAEQQGPLCAPPDARWRRAFLAVPASLDPRVKTLAQRVGAPAKTARDKVRAVENYLMSHHAYSLNARPGHGDPLSDFLLNGRSAHCEYFASSAVILLRCLGVPSRYVIGYLAHEPDGANAMVVRGRDAHAWAESWLGDRWITVEATPGGGRPAGRAEPLPWKLKLREQLSGLLAAATRWLERLRNLPLGVWLAATALLFAWLIFSAWRQRAKAAHADEFRYASRDEELARLAARFEKWLARRGAPCPPERAWSRHAQAMNLAAALPFVRAYEAARFGPQRGDLTTLKRLLDEMEKLS